MSYLVVASLLLELHVSEEEAGWDDSPYGGHVLVRDPHHLHRVLSAGELLDVINAGDPEPASRHEGVVLGIIQQHLSWNIEISKDIWHGRYLVQSICINNRTKPSVLVTVRSQLETVWSVDARHLIIIHSSLPSSLMSRQWRDCSGVEYSCSTDWQLKIAILVSTNEVPVFTNIYQSKISIRPSQDYWHLHSGREKK